MLAQTLLGGLAIAGQSSDQCQACHQNPDFYAQNPKLYSYYQDWVNSPHASSGLSCSSCHGGDPTVRDADKAHKGVLGTSASKGMLYFKNQPDTCGACHADKAAQFKQSKHYKALQADRIAPTCTTCHRAMNRRPYFREILVKACENCHNPENKEHIPLVAEQAEQALQRLNIAKGYLGWTRVYYESQGWPGQSRCQIDAISTKYEEAVTGVHAFDLVKMHKSSTEILTELKMIFQDAWDKRKEKQ